MSGSPNVSSALVPSAFKNRTLFVVEPLTLGCIHVRLAILVIVPGHYAPQDIDERPTDVLTER